MFSGVKVVDESNISKLLSLKEINLHEIYPSGARSTAHIDGH